MKRRYLLQAAVAAVIATALPAAAETQTIRVANLEIAPFLPVAYAAKIASKHGIKVEVVNFRRGLEAANALKAGEVDVAVGGVEAAISAIGGGAPAVIVAGCSTGGLAWVSAKDAPINSVDDLKGKSFAVIRGLHELVMLAEFEKHKLKIVEDKSPDGVHVVYINSPPSLNVALKGGDVDAMSAPEPFPSRAISEGYAKPLIRPFDTALRDVPRAIFMRKDFIEKNPELAQKYVDSIVDATKQLRDSPALAKDFALNDALKEAITEQDWDLSVDNIKFDVSLDADEIGAYITYMTKYGMLKASIDEAAVTSLDMLAKAKASQGW
ncbi:ABC transporter substrate-binding protein [Chelatococcus sp. GCM10030263]|uniref:ABC transporter substrate-binding protein n=1 Tax=Chelatococcus sp. GCM10030263 TaxID=3273387 RepID=UPI00361B2218